jgi:hypothetical protein
MCAARNLQPLVRSNLDTYRVAEWRALVIHCYRCGRDGHISPNCWAQYHKEGMKLLISDDETDATSLRSETLGSEDSPDSLVMGIHIPMVHEAVEKKIREKNEYIRRQEFKESVKQVAMARRLREYGVDHWINKK